MAQRPAGIVGQAIAFCGLSFVPLKDRRQRTIACPTASRLATGTQDAILPHKRN
jgi:hypothetical protein